MNNLKKIGLTALAGSLVVTSAFAGELTASGSASMGVANITGTGDDGLGKNFSMANSVYLAGSGEMDNGWSYSVFTGTAGQDLATDSNSLTITMGDMGTFSFDQGVGIAGITTLKNEVPTAYEEAGHGVSTSGNSGTYERFIFITPFCH